MSGPRHSYSDTTPLLKQHHHDDDHHHHHRFSSHPAAIEMTTPPPPRRTVYLGVDVGTGSARAGTSLSTIFLSFPNDVSFLGLFVYTVVKIGGLGFDYLLLALLEIGFGRFLFFSLFFPWHILLFISSDISVLRRIVPALVMGQHAKESFCK